SVLAVAQGRAGGCGYRTRPAPTPERRRLVAPGANRRGGLPATPHRTGAGQGPPWVLVRPAHPRAGLPFLAPFRRGTQTARSVAQCHRPGLRWGEGPVGVGALVRSGLLLLRHSLRSTRAPAHHP